MASLEHSDAGIGPSLGPAGAGITRRSMLGAFGLAAAAAPFASATVAAGGEVVPFRFVASEASLSDQRARLMHVRYPEPSAKIGSQTGPVLDNLRALVDYWRSDYTWRRCEAELNRWPQFKTEIDGLGIHFIHVRSRHPNATPLILTHGWPSTILLFREVIAPLTDPTTHGGSAADAFDVVIPSLPGFGFSDKPTAPGWDAARTARAWAVLMQRLGYRAYVAQGGDWGAFVTTAMAQQGHPGLRAINLNFPQVIPDRLPQILTKEERRAVEAKAAYRKNDAGYAFLQSTRPQLAGYLLSDSPMAQAAWLYDMFDGGTGRTGDPAAFISRDKMLDEITLYWLTNSGASSARFYDEQKNVFVRRGNVGRVPIPVAVSLFPKDMPAALSWGRLFYPKLFYWHEARAGGHFASLEVPDLFVDEMRASFGKLDGR